jgi:hypothetical protein
MSQQATDTEILRAQAGVIAHLRAENERQAARMKALDEERGRLRMILETIRDAIVHRRSISGHIDYRPLRDFVEEALNGTAEG